MIFLGFGEGSDSGKSQRRRVFCECQVSQFQIKAVTLTLPETNVTPENRPSQKGNDRIPTIHL